MGIYLNPGAGQFLTARSSKIYVDKTMLLRELDEVFGMEQRFVCVSRPRRFGKTMAANMVCAYYDRTVAADVFSGLAIARGEGFSDKRGACDVLRINMQEFLSEAQNIEDLLQELQEALLWELLGEYASLCYRRKDKLRLVMQAAPLRHRHRRMGLHLPRVSARYKGAAPTSRLSAGLAEGQGVCRSRLYDGHPACQKIRYTLGAQYVYGILHGESWPVRAVCRLYGR